MSAHHRVKRLLTISDIRSQIGDGPANGALAAIRQRHHDKGWPTRNRLDRAHFLSPYGSSKQLTEVMLRDVAAAHHMRYAVLRYFNVAGVDPATRHGQSTANATHLIKLAVQRALGMRSHMEVYRSDYPTRNGTCIRDYVHVSDLVAAHLQALSHLTNGGESLVVNCAYGHGYSISEVIETVRKVLGRSVDARLAPRRVGDPAAIMADSTRIRSKLGWEPRLDDRPLIVEHTPCSGKPCCASGTSGSRAAN
jgi:UDP-glucose 4-epimerase